MARYSNRRVQKVSRPGGFDRPTSYRPKRTKTELKINLRSLIAVVLTLALIWGWWRTLAIKKVVVEGSRYYQAQLVSDAVSDQLHKHWWWHNLTLLDTRRLQKAILASQPQLSDVAISRRWPSGVNLKVTERQPNLAWQSGGQTYLLSGEGIVAAQAGGGDLSLPVVEDTTNLPVKLGAQVVPARFIAFTLELINLLPKQGLQVTNLKVPATTTEVYAGTNQGYYVKFDTTRSAQAEVGDLAKVLNLLKSQNKKPSEYIDLRIEDKAYYK
ncbi:MAG TPA: FtsQ-type POTRA domain-containing protein [Candidatus Saccharimonadales bacterium]|nr:FtsQ-type POTRA domain-containing protein [Candidatus Saccharimonadales bacterium]